MGESKQKAHSKVRNEFEEPPVAWVQFENQIRVKCLLADLSQKPHNSKSYFKVYCIDSFSLEYDFCSANTRTEIMRICLILSSHIGQ